MCGDRCRPCSAAVLLLLLHVVRTSRFIHAAWLSQVCGRAAAHRLASWPLLASDQVFETHCSLPMVANSLLSCENATAVTSKSCSCRRAHMTPWRGE